MTDRAGDPALAAAVRAARQARGTTLRALAAKAGISAGTLSGIETAKTSLSDERLAALAEALGTTAATLREPARAEPTSRTDWRHFEPLDLDPVLAAAVRLVVRRGYAATTMREIAQEAGLSVAGVYHHYPHKQDLLVAALDLTMTELHERVAAAREEGSSPAERFALMVEALALFHAHRPDLAFIGASEMRSFEEPHLTRVRKERNALQHLIDEQALAAIDDGSFTVDDPLPALRAVSTMCTSLPQWFRADGSLSADDIAREFSRLAVSMLGGSR
ncbi:TetR family transcriptional regulator [Nocardioides alcanivorans]|uniref:TetR family transcriptional regulator n=1 Tax=Nocardioides alcanivorans TaxID=2897352 RepID=UPI001F3AA635|nr:TetR family transcriptional regulator [Nocardioides alcanivorans]